jgi:exodeoxyribonuclease VIII
MVDADAARNWSIIVNEFEPTYPCVVHGLPASVYHGIDAMSYSRLKTLDQATPSHLTYNLANPSDSDDFVVGRALHAYVLERSNFNHEFAIAPQVDRRTKDGKAAYEAFVSASQNKTVLSADQFAMVEDMAASVMQHADAYAFAHTFPGKAEVSAFAMINGIKTKSRFDRLVNLDGEDVIVDIKTTRDLASREEFENSIWRYGYGTQCNLYLQMARAVGLNPRHFVFIVIEKKKPHKVAVYRMSDEVIEMFDGRVREMTNKYKVFLDHPDRGYEGICEIGVPSWALRRLENEIGESINV